MSGGVLPKIVKYKPFMDVRKSKKVNNIGSAVSKILCNLPIYRQTHRHPVIFI